MNSFFRDLAFGVRMLIKTPGLTIVAVLSLAVGIGINSTVFSFVNAVLLKPFSVSNNEGLVYVFTGEPGDPYQSTSYENYRQLAEQNDVFSGLAAYAAPPMLMTSGEHTEEVSSEVVSENFFSVLDVAMQRGRGFARNPNEPSSHEPTVVVSDSLWKRRFNSDPDLIGKRVTLNGNSFSVVGIASATFKGTDPTISTDVWVQIIDWANIIQTAPANADAASAGTTTPPKDKGRLGRGESWLAMIGRLKPGVSLEQAHAAMSTIATRLPVSDQRRDDRIQVSISSTTALHPQIIEEIPVGLIIMAVAALVLTICCVNVASLMVSRAAARQKEFAVRIAVGSSRSRLVRQLFTEALLLSLLGGATGLLLANWTTRAILQFVPAGDLSLSADISVDQKVLWFSFAISIVTAVMFGVFPVLGSFRVDLVRLLSGGMISSGGTRRRITARRVFVVLQIVASLVLLIGDGLFVRSFRRGRSISQNLNTDRILLLNLSPKKYGYTVNYTRSFYQQLLSRMQNTPGVASATLSTLVPLALNSETTMARIDGGQTARLQCATVADGYFETLGIQIVQGRGFVASDDLSSHKVIVINETMVRTFWPGQNPLGKTLKMDQPYEIVGVAKDSSLNNLGNAAEPFFYQSLYQNKDSQATLIVRTNVPPATMIATVQREIKQLGTNLPIFDFKTLDEVTNSGLLLVKAAASVLSVLSVIGLLVACIGIYGVTSYAFSQRRKEIGIRMSLGAQRTDILQLIMREGITLTLVGISIGMLLALGTTHLLSSFLYGVSPIDPLVFLTVTALLGLVALGASLVPAIAAAKTNPLEALRYE